MTGCPGLLLWKSVVVMPRASMATNAREAGITQRQAPSHLAASRRTAGCRISDKPSARNGLSNNGSAIFFPMAGQINPSPAKAARPVPTIAPVRACVVDTGRPVREATSTHTIAPVTIARATVGSSGAPVWRRPWLKVLTMAPATSAETLAPAIVQPVPHAMAVR